MPRLDRLTPAAAVGASRDLLTELVAQHGQVGDMVATMAHSPAVLSGYLQLSRAMKRSKLSRKASERISIAVQTQQGCSLCLQSHIDAARGIGITDDEIEQAKRGTSGDPAFAAIIDLGLRIYQGPASVTDEHVERVRELGFSDREIADVVGIVALNLLTGAFNLVAGLTPGHDAD
ncbi:carboxymuconolactone decarboxylase family protein [Brevibacterium luteolum]|uniref:carboxymuconolactone decarboxylase family protein n=1 Tax=Brevibacterium luteolum TaxID=199591 RepID=UPI001C224BE4|nr:carboxymuconolactone decarboxylase family protein [Brevibacterium luteolum]MBU8577626.1 carboxymuconolactone decarboxylase family protein [Brevibacterium luteolum]